MRVLAIDLGTVRCGIALSDVLGMLATPMTPVMVLGGADLPQRLAQCIEMHDAKHVLIGWPLNMDGSCSPRSRAAEVMQERLSALCSVPVELFDERLTSVEASRRLTEAGHGSRAQRGRIDSASAAVLLQAWLDMHCPSTKGDM